MLIDFLIYSYYFYLNFRELILVGITLLRPFGKENLGYPRYANPWSPNHL